MRCSTRYGSTAAAVAGIGVLRHSCSSKRGVRLRCDQCTRDLRHAVRPYICGCICNLEMRIRDLDQLALSLLLIFSVLNRYGSLTGNKVMYLRPVLVHLTAPVPRRVLVCPTQFLFYSEPRFFPGARKNENFY